jgi:hypothetical protein
MVSLEWKAECSTWDGEVKLLMILKMATKPCGLVKEGCRIVDRMETVEVVIGGKQLMDITIAQGSVI